MKSLIINFFHWLQDDDTRHHHHVEITPSHHSFFSIRDRRCRRCRRVWTELEQTEPRPTHRNVVGGFGSVLGILTTAEPLELRFIKLDTAHHDLQVLRQDFDHVLDEIKLEPQELEELTELYLKRWSDRSDRD